MGCTRLVYNRALAARTEAWYERQERVGYAETSTMLTDWKKQEDLQFLGVEDLSGSNLVKNHKLALASG
jgi:Helix-turn-helix domain.